MAKTHPRSRARRTGTPRGRGAPLPIPIDATTSAEVLVGSDGTALAEALDDGATAAAAAGLRYVAAGEPGHARRRRGRGFVIVDAHDHIVRNPKVLDRIRSLAIPPAWQKVWICRDPDGHIQATGRDARGRLQYRYHPRWRAVRDAANHDRLREFFGALPRLRAAVARDLACRCPCKDKVTAAVVALIERGHLRVGNDAYTRANGSYGATTLLCRHTRVHGDTVELDYRAKGGKRRAVRFTDRRLARVIGQLARQPGARLFRWRDGMRLHPIRAHDVNAYLHRHAGVRCTAKVFRTWAATVAAALALAGAPSVTTATARKRTALAVVRQVAERLGNTPAVCRRSYIHPLLLARFVAGELEPGLARLRRVRSPARVEPVVASLLGDAA